MDYKLYSVATDYVMPSQFFNATTETGSFWNSERRLMYACLEDALNQVRLGKSPQVRKQHLAQESVAWIMSDDCTWPFAFLTICHHLHIEPDNIRRYVRLFLSSDIPMTKTRATARNKGLNPNIGLVRKA